MASFEAHPCRVTQRRGLWLDEAAPSRALAVRPRGASDPPATATTIISVLARAVRAVEAAAQRGPVSPSVRTKFQVVALLLREEHARVRAEQASSEAQRAEQLKRLDGIATILARTAARDPALLALLAEDAVVSDAANRSSGRCCGPPASSRPPRRRAGGGRAAPAAAERRVVPQSVVSRQLANPFLAPDFTRRPAEPGASAPAGRLGAARPAASARSSRPVAAPRPAWRCPRRPPCGRRAAGS